MKSSEFRYVEDIRQLGHAAAEIVYQTAVRCVNERGYFTLALSGGSTPKALYSLLTEAPYVHHIPWGQTHFFWGDERAVPPEHEQSNFTMAARTMIDHLPVFAEHVHRIPAEFPSPEEAAQQYEDTLRAQLPVFDPVSRQKQVPVFDLMLLGMGPDGHTASLFPESPGLEEQDRWVIATPETEMAPRVRRITLTFPVLNAAKTVLFLVSGEEKQQIVRAIQKEPLEAQQRYPAARVRPDDGRLFWLIVS